MLYVISRFLQIRIDLEFFNNTNFIIKDMFIYMRDIKWYDNILNIIKNEYLRFITHILYKQKNILLFLMAII